MRALSLKKQSATKNAGLLAEFNFHYRIQTGSIASNPARVQDPGRVDSVPKLDLD